MKADTAPGNDVEFRMSDLCQILQTYLEEDQIAEVYRAYLISAEAHDGQYRMTGEAYIFHPVAVAKILAEMHMDHKSIAAALLHDVIEDTGISKEGLIEEFDEEIAEMVDGVSKLTQIKFDSPAEAQAENFRKMMLAMVKDIRVILVKLADRLHNMRTLGVMRPAKRRRIAHETLEIYAPIAHRLGMNNFRFELEDLGFAALYPMRYRVIKEAIIRTRGHRKEIMEKIESSIDARLEQEEILGRVLGREKHPYSIYKKMRIKSMTFNEVLDVYAFRIIIDHVDTCYRTLGVMHNLYKPVPGRFKDYIAIPKANGYQSLHSVLIGPFDLPIEIQIRTDDMHKVAEAGIAAHWLYKAGEETNNSAHARAREWLRGLLEMQKTAGNSMEFLESVKIDLFPDEVYVFTPQGEIMVLPRGATPVDFAYAVHTDVGNTCVATKINRKLAPLRTPLVNGQTVEAITTSVARPNPAWLNFVVTAKARSNIRNYLKNLHREDAINLGKHLLQRSLTNLRQIALEDLEDDALNSLLENMKYPDAEHLYEEIGLGKQMAVLIAKRLTRAIEDESDEHEVETSNSGSLAIKGTEGLVLTFARCCRPIPGDPILGFVSSGRGIVVHRDSCNNLSEQREKPEKWIDVEWAPNSEAEFTVDIHVEVHNEKGVLATVAAEISDLGCNIENVQMTERDGTFSTMNFTITVRDRVHLARIIKRIRHAPQVLKINRLK